MTDSRPFLAITSGDPAGIGPRVGAAAALDPGLRRRCRPLLVGDAGTFRRYIPPRTAVAISSDLSGPRDLPGRINILHIPHPGIAALKFGVPSRLSGECAVAALRAAVALVLRGGAAAMVTGPVSKESLKLAKVPHPGHTELLQAMTGAARVEMLMTAGPLRALLVTRHVPLKDVPGRLSAREIVAAVRLTDRFMAPILRRAPRWAVCGLNPHAGDNGLLGAEEERIVAPAVRKLRSLGLRVEGPLPADVAWARHAQGLFDACACLYHDQGMIPLKTLYPKKVVNVTVGLPFIRTSPGHGTAFDLAAGRRPFAAADPSATIEAAHRALDLAENRRHT